MWSSPPDVEAFARARAALISERARATAAKAVHVHMHAALLHKRHAVIAEELAEAVEVARDSRIRAQQLRELAERERGRIGKEYDLARRALARVGRSSVQSPAH